MHIKKLKNIQETLATVAEEQLEHLECVDAKELGEVIDIIKDIEETIYYCTITKAMKGETEHEKENVMYYMPIRYEEKCAKTHPTTSTHDMHTPKMMHHTENEHSHISEDEREGKSHRFRRMYIEAKETKQDKTA